MSFLVSPGVQVKEIDLTNVVPAVATSIGAIACPFEKEPVSEVTNISSEEQLVKVFGKPQTTENQYEWWFTACKLFAVCKSTQCCESRVWYIERNRSSTGLLIRNTEHYLESFGDGQGSVGEWTQELLGHMVTQ